MFASFQPYLCLTQTYSRLVKRALSVVIDHDYTVTQINNGKKKPRKTLLVTQISCASTCCGLIFDAEPGFALNLCSYKTVLIKKEV